MQPLMEGAETVNKIAHAERMALAVVAERNGDATVWFAHNIVSIVGAWRKNGAGTFEPTKDDSDVQPLYTRSGDLERYLDWARTVM
jgi:anaerobic selenocysteine-containing dehydrogenase